MAHYRELTGEIGRIIDSKLKSASRILTKEITTLVTEDVQVITFKENNLIKMAVGIINDKDAVPSPLIVFGAGDGNGNNRGYISKGTDGLSMYYIGNKNAGEVAGLKLKKDGVYSTHKIVVDAGLGTEFIVNATNWNAKLEEASTKSILENSGKSWNIPKENLKDSDVSNWDGKETTSGAQAKADAAYASALANSQSYANLKKSELALSLRLTGNLPTSITQDTNGITATVTGDPTSYARLSGAGLLINNGAILIKATDGETFISGTGINASYINAGSLSAERILAGTLTGFTIQTASTGYRTVMKTAGTYPDYSIAGLDNSDEYHGLVVIPSVADLVMYEHGVEAFRIYMADPGAKVVKLKGYEHDILGYNHTNQKTYPLGSWDFGSCTVTGLTGGGGWTGGDIDIGGTTKSHQNGSGTWVSDTTTIFAVSSEFIPWSMDTKLMVKSEHLTQPYTIMEIMSDSTNVQSRESTMALHVYDSVNGDYFADISLLTYEDDPRMVFVAQSRDVKPPWMGHVISTDYFGTLMTLEGLRYTATGQSKGETRWRRTSDDHVNMVRFGDYSSMTERLSWANPAAATNRKLAIMFNAYCVDYANNYYTQYNAYADSYKFEMDGSAKDSSAGGGFIFSTRNTLNAGIGVHNDNEWDLCMNLHKNGMVFGSGDFYIAHGYGTGDLYIGKAAKNTKFLGIVDFSGASSVTGFTAVFG